MSSMDERCSDDIFASMRREAERFFQADFSGVAIRRGSGVADAMGVGALARVNEIHCSSLLCRSRSEDVRRVLFHEFAHVLQQRNGHVSDVSDDAVICRPALETEADLAGACAWESPTRRTYEYLLDRLHRVVAAATPCWQPVVQIQGTSRTFNDLWAALNSDDGINILKLKGVTRKEKEKVKSKLKHWVEAPMHRSFFHTKKKGHNKQFGSIDELGRALVGRIRSTESKAIEKALAKRVDSSKWIQKQVNILLDNLYVFHQWMKNNADWIGNSSMGRSLASNWEDQDMGPGDHSAYVRGLIDEFSTEKGRYAFFYSPAISAVRRGSARDLESALQYFRKKKHEAKSYKIAALLADYVMVFRDLIPDDHIPYHVECGSARSSHWNVNENDEWVIHARANNVRLGAGPSATTMQVLRVIIFVRSFMRNRSLGNTDLTNEDKDMMRAVSLALFAFWNQHANQKRAEIHTFHEVMIVLHGYGVDLERDNEALGRFEYPHLHEIPD